MKKESSHPFQVRFTAELHSTLKDAAAALGQSMHVHILHVLEESLTRYPSMASDPVIAKPSDTGFALRIPVALHTELVIASRGSERSMNLEIVGRLILMTSPSQQSVTDAWCVLDQAISTLLEHAPNQDAGVELARARQCFEWKLQHSLAASGADR